MRTDVSTHPTIRAQFRDIYRTRTSRARDAARQPAQVAALLDASRPAQIAPPTPTARVGDGSTISTHPPGEIRPAPQDWKQDTGNRRAELEAAMKRVGGGL